MVRVSVSREADFEQGCAHLFARGLLPVTRLLEDLSEYCAECCVCVCVCKCEYLLILPALSVCMCR